MSVIVSDGMSIEQALKLLWRESNRENVPNVAKLQQYRIKPTEIRHAFNKQWEKTKRKRRAHRRKIQRMGRLRELL